MNIHGSKQKGLSLVELMISMAISAVVTVGVVNLFAANSETYKLMQGQSRMQESARFGLDFLSRAVQQAGFKGCFSKNEDVYFMMNDDTEIPYEFNITRGMIGYESMLSGVWSPVLTALDTPYITGNEIDTSTILVGTDVLTVRSISSTDAALFSDLPTSTEDIEVTVPTTGLGFSAAPDVTKDDLALIHDCEKATIFVVTAIADDTPSAGKATIKHDIEVTTPGNTKNTLAEVNTFETDAAVAAIVTSTFYIAPGAGINNDGDAPFSLWRKSGTSAPAELVEGVEDFQVLYGIDSNNTGTPNQYVSANLVTDYTAVITVRLSITVNSIDGVGGTSAPTFGCIAGGGRQSCYSGESVDGLLRRTFHQTVQVRNKG
jgi:type IV pilus assembly protein PilW